MRHVPEEELHAYLDQALSRSQCVEIETHLARCSACRDARDETAALRDRTTALLAALTPRPLIIPPPMNTLVLRQAAPAPSGWAHRSRRLGLWAAGVAAAVGAGWLARAATVSAPGRTPVAAVATIANASPEPATELKDEPPTETIDPEPRRLEAVHQPPPRSDGPPPAPVVPLPVNAVAPSEQPSDGSLRAPQLGTRPAFDQLFRAVEWEEAVALTGGRLPLIAGLVVHKVHLQPGSNGEGPTVVVAQVLPSGEILQSIEGPLHKVKEFLGGSLAPGENASELARTTPDYVRSASGTTRLLRALAVVGRVPVDSLTLLARAAAMRQ
ncbi:MAG TPA: zf-HC2 domain-containing protein [Gemmatimonadales bacterium]|nr:zf-HC2 domain-containing protein [Gemmatimonadales bacterium]